MDKKSSLGFTLPEFLVVLAFVALLLIVFAARMQQSYIPRAADARRKADLEKLAVAFEDYYNDNGCYPDETILEQCNSEALAPYVEKVPCDPDKTPYRYIPNEANQCSGYRLLAQLRYESDPEIREMPCYEPYNYGISVGIPLIPDGCEAMGTPTPAPTSSYRPSPVPTPSPPPYLDGFYACDPEGVCNVYDDPVAAGCPTTFDEYNLCVAGCVSPANRCQR